MRELLKNREFQIWQYSVSHSSLLIRSPYNKSMNINCNVDIYFSDVRYMAIPKFLGEILMVEPNESEKKYLEKIMNENLKLEDITVLESINNGFRYHIIAMEPIVELNNMELFQTKVINPFERQNI